MPKKNVTDLITDLEMHYARLILAGTMTDRQAAEAAGLDPNSAAYIKSKPRVRAYMLEHRAAENEIAPPPVVPPFYVSEWMRNQQTAQAQEEAEPEPQSAPSPDPAPIALPSSRPIVTSQTTSSVPRVPMADYCAPDTRRPFSIENRFGRRR
jgi:hypothetical protein